MNTQHSGKSVRQSGSSKSTDIRPYDQEPPNSGEIHHEAYLYEARMNTCDNYYTINDDSSTVISTVIIPADIYWVLVKCFRVLSTLALCTFQKYWPEMDSGQCHKNTRQETDTSGSWPRTQSRQVARLQSTDICHTSSPRSKNAFSMTKCFLKIVFVLLY